MRKEKPTLRHGRARRVTMQSVYYVRQGIRLPMALLLGSLGAVTGLFTLLCLFGILMTLYGLISALGATVSMNESLGPLVFWLAFEAFLLFLSGGLTYIFVNAALEITIAPRGSLVNPDLPNANEALPEEEVLVRASIAPDAAQKETLLRPAAATDETAPQTLLRAANGKAKD